MTDLNQHFSIFAGDDTEVLFNIGPDEDGVNLEFVELTWKAYTQANGVADMTAPLITKTVGSGIEITDPLLMEFTVTIDDADIAGLSGNYYYEIKLVGDITNTTTATTGLMTVIDPAVSPNVVAFKAMFPDFVEIDDTEVQIALDAAGQFVDSTWGASQTPATMYLAAHFLVQAESTSSSSGSADTGKITSVTVPGISVRYATSKSSGGSAKDTGSLDETPYGVAFANMLTAQGYGIAIV